MRQQMKTFDTYTHINELKKAGFKEEQAAVIIKSLMDIRETDISTLATKDQVNVLINDTKAQIDSLRKDTKSQIESLRNETKALILETHASTLKWMVGTMIAFSCIILAGLKLL
jgi:tRNA(Ile)-lysidine synthase TilS/MesJ